MTDRWYDRAACRAPGVDPELWFWETYGRREAFAVARSICRTCPVRAECLNDAMDREAGAGLGARYGIFGGLTAGQRHKLDQGPRRNKNGELIPIPPDAPPREGKRGTTTTPELREYRRLKNARNRAARFAAGNFDHGTRYAYDTGCRCELCREVRRAAYAEAKRVRLLREAEEAIAMQYESLLALDWTPPPGDA